METLKKLRVLNGNTLKILAAIFMFIDHMAVLLFPKVLWLRQIGRLAMPLFAFMIAEGCRYTRNKYKHFMLLFGLGVACQIVYIIFDPHNMYLGILLTFSISTLIIYAMQYAKKCFFPPQAEIDELAATNAGVLSTGAENASLPQTQAWQKTLSLLLVATLIALSYLLCSLVMVDYGFWGIMMPVFASIFDFHRIPAPEKLKKLDCLPLQILCMMLMEIMLIITHPQPSFQLPSLFAFLLLLFYNGKKGKAKLKYFFYIFYPLHLGILQGIVFLLPFLT